MLRSTEQGCQDPSEQQAAAPCFPPALQLLHSALFLINAQPPAATGHGCNWCLSQQQGWVPHCKAKEDLQLRSFFCARCLTWLDALQICNYWNDSWGEAWWCQQGVPDDVRWTRLDRGAERQGDSPTSCLSCTGCKWCH